MNPIYAVILAGDNADRKIKQGSVIANKAFVSINGRRMIDFVLDCYRSMDDLEAVGVIGPSDKINSLGEDIVTIPQQGGMIPNVLAAAETFKEGWLLLSSCDIPLITPMAIRDFLSKCTGADMFYPLVAKADCQRVFPDMKRTWVKLKDGLFTGGNVVMIKTSSVPVAAGPAGAFFDARKSPAQLASLIGISTLIKLALKTLTIKELETKMGKILGLKCKAVVTEFPEIGTDVDKESDYNIVSARLKLAR